VVDAEGRPIRMDEVAEGEVRMGYLGEDVVLIMREGPVFRAWSGVCTHMACTVRWLAAERQFACPCHGARFNEKGDVSRGPATAPLQRIGVRVRDGKFYGA
jgi:cytochrome b6-f complex iron-sulfur subunit